MNKLIKFCLSSAAAASLLTSCTAAAKKINIISCEPLARIDALEIPKNSQEQTVIDIFPTVLSNTGGSSVIYTQGTQDKADGIKAALLIRDAQGRFKGSTQALPIVQTALDGHGNLILDYTPTKIPANQRMVLVILLPVGYRLNHTIIPVGSNPNQARQVVFYPAKFHQSLLVSPFLELSNGVTKGVPVSDQLNQLLNNQDAAGNIFIPSVYRTAVKVQNLEVRDFTRCT